MNIFRGKQGAASKQAGDGLIIFDAVPDAIKAEKILKEAGYTPKMVSPPPELRKGCDLALEIFLAEQAGIEWILKEKEAHYVNIAPITKNTPPLLDSTKVVDYGKWIMIQAGNMKLTYRKESGLIVNTSGGGCPDVPYLHAQMVGKLLTEAPRPRNIVGATLCTLMLDRALVEGLKLQEVTK
jgi:hypothetical protein